MSTPVLDRPAGILPLFRTIVLQLIAKILPHANRETTELNKAQEIGSVIFMERQNSTKVRQPGKQMLHFATSLVTTQWPAVLSERVVSIRPMRVNHFDPSLLELGVKFVAVVGRGPDQSFRGIGNKPTFNSILEPLLPLRRGNAAGTPLL